ncbi:MAG: hypothetical protein H7842_10345 [Gammaproteobacteria bacterium SHHR-1]
MNLNPRLLWLIIGLLLLALAGVAVYKAWPVLFPPLEQRLAPDPDCNLRVGPCVTTLPDGGELSLSIEPRNIPMVTPLHLQVRLKGVKADAVEVDFSGVDMYMGYNRVPLENQGDGLYQGEGRLPVCVYDAMEWEAQVLVKDSKGLLSVPFRFITVKGG